LIGLWIRLDCGLDWIGLDYDWIVDWIGLWIGLDCGLDWIGLDCGLIDERFGL